MPFVLCSTRLAGTQTAVPPRRKVGNQATKAHLSQSSAGTAWTASAKTVVIR